MILMPVLKTWCWIKTIPLKPLRLMLEHEMKLNREVKVWSHLEFKRLEVLRDTYTRQSVSVFMYYSHTTCMQLGEIDWFWQIVALKPKIGSSFLFKAFEWPLNKMCGRYCMIWRELPVIMSCLLCIFFSVSLTFFFYPIFLNFTLEILRVFSWGSDKKFCLHSDIPFCVC